MTSIAGRPGDVPPDEAPRAASAAELLDRARSQPAETFNAAAALSEATCDLGVQATAHRAAGQAADELGALAEAERRLRASLEACVRSGNERMAAENRMDLSFLALRQGRTDEAEAFARAAEIDLREQLSAQYYDRLGVLRARRGDQEGGMAAFDRAIATLASSPDARTEARVRNNRALLHAQARDYPAALADMEAVEDLFAADGDAVGVAKARHNRAVVLAQAGQVTAALPLINDADRALADLGVDRSIPLYDRCQLLADAGLIDDALPVGSAAAAALRGAGAALELAELELLLGRLAILRDRPLEAERHLIEAARMGADQDLTVLRSSAERLLAMTRLVWPAACLAPAKPVDTAVGPAPWPPPGAEVGDSGARLHLCLRLLEQDRCSEAALVAGVDRREAFSRGLVQYAAGDELGALRSVSEGFSELDRQLALDSAMDQRPAMLRDGRQLGTLGVRIGADHRSADECYQWSERARSLAGRGRLVAPSSPALRQGLDELRAVRAERSAATDPAVLSDLRRSEALLERRARQAAWGEAGDRQPERRSYVGLAELRSRLGDHSLVSFVDSACHLFAVVVDAAGSRLVDLGPSEPIGVALAGMRAALSRLAGVTDPDRRALLARRLAPATHRLDRLLLEPLRLATEQVVIVPTGELAGVAWPLLRSLADRLVSVSLSASTWRPPPAEIPERALVVAGRHLDHADDEAADVAALYPASTTLYGEAASSTSIDGALPGNHVAHLVAHGDLRRDNPLLSSLLVGDGPYYAIEFDRVSDLPPVMVWSSCDLGRLGAGDDQLLGVTAALGGRRCHTLIAATEPVSDAEARPAMVDLHRHLRAGESPAEALAHAQRAAIERGSLSVASFCAFSVP